MNTYILGAQWEAYPPSGCVDGCNTARSQPKKHQPPAALYCELLHHTRVGGGIQPKIRNVRLFLSQCAAVAASPGGCS
jgi:hypothetical protein